MTRVASRALVPEDEAAQRSRPRSRTTPQRAPRRSGSPRTYRTKATAADFEHGPLRKRHPLRPGAPCDGAARIRDRRLRRAAQWPRPHVTLHPPGRSPILRSATSPDCRQPERSSDLSPAPSTECCRAYALGDRSATRRRAPGDHCHERCLVAAHRPPRLRLFWLSSALLTCLFLLL